MPGLTSPPAVRAPSLCGSGPCFAAPGVAHPLLAPGEWAEPARPDVAVHWAVLDTADGPAARADLRCQVAGERLQRAGTAVLGRLEMLGGHRPFSDLVMAAHRYLDWYGVDGFYLAGCPVGPEQLDETRRAASTLRALCEGDGYLVAGHGTHPDPAYARCADQLVTFAGHWTEYRWLQAPQWTADHPPERFCHLVHGLPALHLEEALRVARWLGAGTIAFTDRTARGGADPWETLPGYWDAFVSRLGTRVSE
jgi:spherulation-specific family 4 protein